MEIQYLEEKLNENKNVKIADNDIDLESDIIIYEKYAKKKTSSICEISIRNASSLGVIWAILRSIINSSALLNRLFRKNCKNWA